MARRTNKNTDYEAIKTHLKKVNSHVYILLVACVVVLMACLGMVYFVLF